MGRVVRGDQDLTEPADEEPERCTYYQYEPYLTLCYRSGFVKAASGGRWRLVLMILSLAGVVVMASCCYGVKLGIGYPWRRVPLGGLEAVQAGMSIGRSPVMFTIRTIC